MQILVIGSGGREHALCWAFAKSPRVSKVFCCAGNAGIADVAECVPIEAHEIEKLADFATERKIDLTFVGGETALALGIKDEFERRGLKIIGPSAAAARLEASKSFAKEFMKRHSIPTARFVSAGSLNEAAAALQSGFFGEAEAPVVVKADGLAAGKGVVVANDRAEALTAIEDMASRVGSEAASRIVLEECLFGREVSLLMFTDGTDFALMPATRDHKRIGEADTGPNTGGMGTITDASLLTEKQTRAIVETIIEPTLRGCREEGFPFSGILFLGIMLAEGITPTESESKLQKPGHKADRYAHFIAPEDAIPMLLEYNVRFGDPETQSILVRLETDIVEICEAMLAGELSKTQIEWKKGNSACVILAAEGYPQKPRAGEIIFGLKEAAARENVTVFHSGTARNDKGEPVTAGGRVLGVTATGTDLETALARAYKAVSDIHWRGMQYRKDIGAKR